MQRLEMWLTRNILILKNILGVPVEDFFGGVLFLLLCIISYPDGRSGYEINPFDTRYQKGRLFRNFQYHAFKFLALYCYFLKRIESLECNYVPELKKTFL